MEKQRSGVTGIMANKEEWLMPLPGKAQSPSTTSDMASTVTLLEKMVWVWGRLDNYLLDMGRQKPYALQQ